MSTMQGPAVPESGNEPDLPTFEQLAADPDIAPLLDFEPVPRQLVKAEGWTPAMQRMFIAWLAWYGSPTNACAELGKARSGVDKLYKSADADSFRASWDAAIALFERRRIAQMTARHGGAGALRAPTVSRGPAASPAANHDGEVVNEYGEWEDEASYRQRGEDARDSVAAKLLRARRHFLREISECPAKRAAFEILSGYAVDWDKAELFEPQADEPWRRPRLREPDYVLTAEAGWLHDLVPYGPDKITQRKAELRKALDAYHAEHRLPPIEWEEGWGG